MSVNRGVVVHAARDLRVDNLPDPEPGPGEVVLDVAYGGVCGSDLHYVDRGGVGDFMLREPMVLGHEVVARVGAVGSGVGSVRDTEVVPGLAVAVHPAIACGHCEQCRTGRANICRQVTYLGSAARFPHVQGGFAQHVLVRADQLVPLPDGLDLRQAAVAEPLAVALHALDRAGDVAGRHLLVTGAGPIGCLLVAAARDRGAAEIVVTDLTDEALAIAAAVGATTTLRADALTPDDWSDVVADLAVEASGSASGLGTCVERVRRGGTVVQLGLLPPGMTPLLGNVLVTREIELRGAFRFTHEIEDAVRMLDRGLNVEPVITHVLPLDQTAQAFAVARDRTKASKVLIAFD
ncbi:L-idonate 5-dehydrogenase [Frankia sp. Cr1]|uniref:L-idonate 5-dehydrogenase n=1 Tax=Frankia sp. Cr1 TaxID=3073931 RepID=UPI002AD37DBA|nr:L-idonate 5-dehydrogenase [Frankia sp. Cr1]